VKRIAKKPPFADLLVSKYRADPEAFRAYLPEVAQALDLMLSPRRSARSPFGLTERDRTHRLNGLQETLERLAQGGIARTAAMRGLEHCATLVQDDSLPEHVDHTTLIRLLTAAIGKSPASVNANATIAVQDEAQQAQVVNRVSLVRGVVLDLTWDMRLVSITVTPRKMVERRHALRLIGIGKESGIDVAERHDEYLARKEPHAAP
jgi:hypothetical protein